MIHIGYLINQEKTNKKEMKMRQIFTKAQLIVMWLSGLIISGILYLHSIKPYISSRGIPIPEGTGFAYEYFDWFQGYVIPVIIFTVLLIISAIPKKKEQD